MSWGRFGDNGGATITAAPMAEERLSITEAAETLGVSPGDDLDLDPSGDRKAESPVWAGQASKRKS